MKISIAMCTFNGAAYVREQLDSIAAQTRQPDEVIICDDCSSDETRVMLDCFAAAAPFPVHVHVNETNLGVVKNFERAIRMCDGDVIALCDQDDVWHAEKLRRLAAEFAASPSVGLVFTDAELIDQNLEPLHRRLWQSTLGVADQRTIAAGRAFELLALRNFVTGATAAFRGRFRDIVLPIPAGMNLIHDYWIALLIAAVADISFISDPLIKYRVHPRQQKGVALEPRRREHLRETNETWRAHQRYFAGEIHKFEMLSDRLKEIRRRDPDANSFPLIERRLEQIQEISTHFRARGNLPRTKLKRLPLVLKELLTRRYHRYAKGVRSAGLDILR